MYITCKKEHNVMETPIFITSSITVVWLYFQQIYIYLKEVYILLYCVLFDITYK